MTRLAAAFAAAFVLLPAALSAEVIAKRKEDGTLLLVSTGKPPASRAVRSLPPPESLRRSIETFAAEHGLDPRLVQALIQVESGYDPRALSRKGAIGLMQLMPETARELGVANPWDAAQNLRGGMRYLRALLDRFAGDVELALAGYNAGPQAVERYRGIPPYPETADYVNKILTLYRGTPARPSVAAPAPAAAGAGAPAASAQPVVRRGRPVRAHRDARGQLVLTTPR